MKKLLLIGAMLCALCSCGSSSSKKALTGTHEGQEWVDLGLPSGLKWATCNLGAENPEDFGVHYVWKGCQSLYCSCRQYGGYSSYLGSQIRSSIGTDDTATSEWGGNWRMPTKEECQELLDNCTWEWTTQNETMGYKVTGPNGQSIFLPAAGTHGYSYGCSVERNMETGRYWSSSPAERAMEGACAYGLDFRKVGYVCGDETTWEREYGVKSCLVDLASSVRPVLAD